MKFQSNTWKHYTLKSGGGRALGYLTHAQVRGIGPLAEAAAATDDAALTQLRANLEKIEADRRTDHTVGLVIPGKTEFAYGLEALQVSDGVCAMMAALAAAPESGITATRLAQSAGYANYSAANLQLGIASAELAEMLGLRTLSEKDAEGRVAATFFIATAGPKEAQTGNWTWRPRPEFATAFGTTKGK